MAQSTGRDLRIFFVAGFVTLVIAAVGAVPAIIFRAQQRVNDRLVGAIDPLITSVQRVDGLILDEAIAERQFFASHDKRDLEPYQRAHVELIDVWTKAEGRAVVVGGEAPVLLARLQSSATAWENGVGGPTASIGLEQYRRDEAVLGEWLRAARRDETQSRDHMVALAQTTLWVLAALGLLGIGALIYIVTRSERWARQAHAEKTLNAEKDEFLSIAAHELKTPLAVIRAQAQSLLGRSTTASIGSLDDERARTRRQLETIERQTTRLTRLIGDILDVSRLQLGRLELHTQEADLSEVAARAVEQMQAAEPRWVFSVTGHDVPVRVDAERIEQVLFNLLSNAVRYSAAGTEVKVAVESRGGESVCAVRDEGIGIPEADRTRLFDRYFRASNAGETRAKGMGLGLYVTAEIVRRHGGRIWVEGELGKGSTFYFAIPNAPSAAS